MLTNNNGVITNSTNAKSKNAYSYAQEQVKLANTSIRTQIETKCANDSSYDATETSNFLELVNLVKNDLRITSENNTSSDGKWKVIGEGNIITITYIDSNISTEAGSENNGEVVTKIAVAKQEIQSFIYDFSLLENEGLTLGANNTKAGSNWKVIGMDPEVDGNVLLAMDPTSNKVTLSTASDWLNCKEKLDGECSKYKVEIEGITYEARSISESDILMLSGYDPMSYSNSVSKYGIKIKDSFYWDKLRAKGYYYTPTGTSEEMMGNYTADYYYFNANVVEDEITKELLFLNNDYFVADTCVDACEYYVMYKVRYISKSSCNANTMTWCQSTTSWNEQSMSIRPVVSIPFSALM